MQIWNLHTNKREIIKNQSRDTVLFTLPFILTSPCSIPRSKGTLCCYCYLDDFYHNCSSLSSAVNSLSVVPLPFRVYSFSASCTLLMASSIEVGPNKGSETIIVFSSAILYALFAYCFFRADSWSFSASQSSLLALSDIDWMKFHRLFNVSND